MKLFAALACLAFASPVMSGCAGGIGLSDMTAPLKTTQADEQGYKLALLTFEAFLDSVDVLKAPGVGLIKPGTPKANGLADAILEAKGHFKTARALLDAGNGKGYAAAMEAASKAVFKARTYLPAPPKEAEQ